MSLYELLFRSHWAPRTRPSSLRHSSSFTPLLSWRKLNEPTNQKDQVVPHLGLQSVLSWAVEQRHLWGYVVDQCLIFIDIDIVLVFKPSISFSSSSDVPWNNKPRLGSRIQSGYSLHCKCLSLIVHPTRSRSYVSPMGAYELLERIRFYKLDCV